MPALPYTVLSRALNLNIFVCYTSFIHLRTYNLPQILDGTKI